MERKRVKNKNGKFCHLEMIIFNEFYSSCFSFKTSFINHNLLKSLHFCNMDSVWTTTIIIITIDCNKHYYSGYPNI